MPVGMFASAVHIAVGVAEFVAVGAKSAGGTATVSIAHPAGTAADQILIAGRAAWRSAAECDPADEAWDELGGVGRWRRRRRRQPLHDRPRRPPGADRGIGRADSVRPDRHPVDDGGGVGLMASYQKYSGSWSVATATGDGATHAANRSVTASSTIAFEPGDVLVAVAAVDTDTNLAAFRAH